MDDTITKKVRNLERDVAALRAENKELRDGIGQVIQNVMDLGRMHNTVAAIVTTMQKENRIICLKNEN